MHIQYLFQFIQILLDVPKTDDATFLLRFARLINGVDLSTYSIEDAEKMDEERSGESVIIKSNDLYTQYAQAGSGTSVNKKTAAISQQIKGHVEAEMKKIVFVLSQEETHWKFQVVAAFAGALLCRFVPPKSDLFAQFTTCVFNQLQSGHYYLRFFAVSAFPALLSIHTEEFRKDRELKKKVDDFKNLKLSLDDAFKYHFILKEDYQNNYLKDPICRNLRLS